MAKVVIDAGICGNVSEVKAELVEGFKVRLHIESTCASIKKMAGQLNEVDALQEFNAKSTDSAIRKAFVENSSHAACPVPAGIIKAVEVAAGLALPKDASIKVSKE